ncbi:hypothetical protein Moror_8278 [Moniliophthora roreri MCA 2997]|uniref:F-box domain-containing protein n=2 Tax=Moniliophthora roreri TaxID=221103 RepID=V2X564_MONRO|nr:hypothetical protein Moror_8278 [Moniliophthora roreri MCA 2997]KAI3607888.1 hypothetical protein WG66_005196 [Moniliophthora roreri]
MAPPLPPELVSLIFINLHNSPGSSNVDLNRCALVCRAWMPEARSLVFRSIFLHNHYHSKASPIGARFLRLCDSPFETFSKAGVQTLIISHYANPKPADFQLDKLLTWRSPDGKRTVLDIVPKLTQLSLSWITWCTLSEQAKRVLHEGFKSVMELDLYNVVFDSYGEFAALLHTFPLLHSLKMTGCFEPSTPVPVSTSGQPLTDLNLKDVSIFGLDDAKLLDALVPSPNLRVFRCRQPSYTFDGRGGSLEAERVRRLLDSASASLEEFVLDGGFYPASPATALYQYIVGLELTRYQNLRLITFTVLTPSLVDVLEGLANSSVHRDGQLEVLNLPYLCSIKDLDWERLDIVLQYPYFSHLKELRCSFTCRFTEEDVARQPQAPIYDTPDTDSEAARDLEMQLLEFRTHLPICEKRGILVPIIDYWYASKCWEIVLPQRRTRREKVVSALRRVLRLMRAIATR